MFNSLWPHGLACQAPLVLHYLPEYAQIHVHWVSDTIQPSHPVPLSSPFASLFPSIRVFSNESALLMAAKVLGFQHQSFQRIFRTDFLLDWLVWSLCSPRDFQEPSPAPQFESIRSAVLNLLYGPILTTIYDYWKNHSFDYIDLCWQSDVSSF